MIKRRVFAVSLLIAMSASSAALFSSRAQAQQTDRAKQIGGKFMCMCSCNQVLTQCNHVGCTTSASMLKELDGWVARGDSETVITSAFVQEFGTKVYAEPPKSGLSLLAWSAHAAAWPKRLRINDRRFVEFGRSILDFVGRQRGSRRLPGTRRFHTAFYLLHPTRCFGPCAAPLQAGPLDGAARHHLRQFARLAL